MGKKIVYIVLGALLIFGLLFLLWSWFFSGTGTGSSNNGQFGTASDTSQTTGASGNGGNGETPLNGASSGQNSANGGISLNGNNSGANGGGTNGVGTNGAGTGSAGVGTGGGTNGAGTGSAGTGTAGSGTGSSIGGGSTLGNGTLTGGTSGTLTVPGVTWLNSSNGTSVGISVITSGNGFTPTSINGINGGSIGGTVPAIGGTLADAGSGNSALNTLLATGLIGAASCALQASGKTVSSLISGGSTAAVTGAAVPAVFVKDVTSNALAGAQAANTATNNAITFQGCITNALAKAALQQITASVVNWINSGFNGSPSFITNYQQFFTNVADLAAGQFIQGAGLSFLCSPFKLQIKVAIAQSYANRGAQSCTLTGVIKNINSFMNGSFTQAGWPGLLQFTTVPTNNPYGAFAYAQVGLQTAQNNALSNAKNSISPNGFIALQQVTCNGSFNSIKPIYGTNNQQAVNAGGSATLPSGCTTKITTPGTVIEGALQSVNDTSLKQLGLANDIDQILNALTTQLVTKTLQGGLLNLSGTTGLQSAYQTPAELAAQAQAQGILTTLQGQITFAEQYGTILQGSISDIENAQNQLNTLTNCWVTAASSTAVTSDQSSAAAADAVTSQAALDALTPQIDSYNNNITNVNAEIATIQQLQSEALTISSTADVTTLTNDYAVAQAAQPFVTQSDVTSAQQNRTTLQSQMGALNQSTQTGLQQCHALPH